MILFLIKLSRILYGSIYLPELFINEIKHHLGKDRPRIGFANDFFEGNPKEIFLGLKDKASCFWVTNSRKTLTELKKMKFEAYYYWNPGTKILHPDAWIDSHASRIPVKKKNTVWIQFNHGIPFKGVKNMSVHEADSMYDAHFLTCKLVFDYYRNERKLNSKILKISGQPLVDPLIRGDLDRDKILNDIGLDPENKTVLYAPTWSHDFNNCNMKTLFPGWEKDQAALLEEVCDFMKERRLNFIVRLHHAAEKSWTDEFDNLGKKFRNFVSLPFSSYPDVVHLLFVSDVLITDYSSIANDFIVLDRPIIYLEPDYELFDEGYLVPPSYRAGHIVTSKKGFFDGLIDSIENPGEFSVMRKKIAKELHYKLDGRSAERAVKTVLDLIGNV